MRWTRRNSMLAVGLAALMLGVGACGGDDDGDEPAATGGGTPAQSKQGGTLVSLADADVDYIDPGATYYTFGFQVAFSTQRPLYNHKPDNPEDPVPDLAQRPPTIAEDGKTVTVKIKRGIKFSPPVDREVKAKDVKYGIERGFFKSVANGYANAYFGDLVGAREGADPGTEIEGITTPDPYTIEFELTKPRGALLAGALSMPLAAPVPEEYAKQYDKQSPSTYGEHQVATGPYMVENNAAGRAIGYKPGRRIHLVRNPSWDKSTDFKPAYLDEIDIREGNSDQTVASRKILEGESMISAEWSPPPAIIRRAATRYKGQMQLIEAGGGRWVTLNTTLKPFDDINVRKAVVAGFNREAMRLTRGGKLVGEIPTHLIPPGVPAHEEAGGLEGPGIDFMSKPAGDPRLAAEYFKKAGYQSGKYEGDETLLMVGTSGGVMQKAAEVAKENFEKLGFKVRLNLVTQDAMYNKYCNVPRAKVHVCPNPKWYKDFSDPETYLGPTFHGDNILPSNNINWPQLDDPEINKAMDEASLLIDPDERAEAWAEVDKMVTERAVVIPWVWDKNPVLRSENVNGVPDSYNGLWSLPFTSLK